ncbi:DNA binding protein [Nitrincola iocasae]|uniref:Uncharacterized protein n=1 Tax=Nitrincola iocasae TaxID=2614693 RepID=A0A5J6LE54_9GAMM|nr:hypothetical protein [Nitrincola iocasae]QEW06870.1 hypothetical protein F5I99_10330 [Nitrincola iocasae]
MKYRSVKLNENSFKNNYILLTEIMDFFPPELIGGSNKVESAEEATLYIGVCEPVKADIDGAKKFFRVRGPLTRRFFEAHELKPGDEVIFERVGHHEYHLYPRRNL